jgi:hypothetical protein
MKTLTKFLEALWAHRGKSQVNFVREGLELARETGVIDRLTPRLRIYRHEDPSVPGELRVKLAAMGVVMAEASFVEAPSCKVVTEIPAASYVEGMERRIASALFPRLVQILVQRSQQKPPEPPKPKLVVG